MSTSNNLVIEHDLPQSRFNATVGAHRAFLDYRLEPSRMVITHTEVPTAIGGRGVAAALTVAALEYARAQSLKVLPACEYAAVFLHRHDEYADLVE